MTTGTVQKLTVLVLSTALFVVGCANPGRVRREIQSYTDMRRYADARAVKVKHNPGGIPKTAEEDVKEEMIREVVNPAEIDDITSNLTRQVRELVSAAKFDEARNVVWKPIPGLVPEVANPVAQVKGKLLREDINRTQFVSLTNMITTAVAEALATNGFAAAHEVLFNSQPVRVYPSAIDGALIDIKKALSDAGISEHEIQETISSARMMLEDIFSDEFIRVKSIASGDVFKPDDKPYRQRLDAFRKALEKQGVPSEESGKAVAAIDGIVVPALRSLWQPREPYNELPPAAIGTSKLNQLVADACCDLYTNRVVPAHVANRVASLREMVVPLVEKGRIDEARSAIYSFGVIGLPEVDDPVFAVKLGLLNARVNIAEWESRHSSISNAVYSALAVLDLDAASAAIASDQPIRAFGTTVSEALDTAALETAKLGRNEGDARKIACETQESLYDIFAPRPDQEREARILDAYRCEVASIEREMRGDEVEPDWSAVSNALEKAAFWLVADDMTREEADSLMKDAMDGFKALECAGIEKGIVELTTEALNKRLEDLKAELSAKVAAGVSAKMAAAVLVGEATTLSREELLERLGRLRDSASEKVSPEFAEALHARTLAGAQEKIAEAEAAKKAAAEKEQAANEAAKKAAAAAKAEVERLRSLALAMAERAASAVDFDARINGFVDAVSDRVEPDINRILGDGARILRLNRAGSKIGKKDATSLLAAALYMGYDDVASLALALEADIDGFAAKDGLERPILLLVMQYGYKGRATTILEKADRNACDIRGDGALHYAVRGGNGTALVELLRLGIDARRPGFAGVTPIVLAADLGYAGFVQALVPFSDLEQADNDGFTALLRASQNGRVDIVRNLAAAGASLSAKTKEGDGPLELAAKANASELLTWLLDEKTIPPTARVVSQLVVAGNVPTLQTMVAHGARLRDEHLAVAVKLGLFPMVKYLVNRGMDVNAESVLKVCREGVPDTSAGGNDGTYYGPDGESILSFLHEQGQRL